jgi:heme/copper-type cytochrome/quinol oxidase subunit 2
MNIPKIPRFARFLPALPLLVARASACPDCLLKNSGGVIEPQTVTAKLAFSASTLFLLGIFLSVVGVMVWMMIKTCRDLDRERTHAAPRKA